MTLHEPHADLKLSELDSASNEFACRSARKVMEALDDAYHLLRTMADSVPDVTLSDPFCSVSNDRCRSAIYHTLLMAIFLCFLH